MKFRVGDKVKAVSATHGWGGVSRGDIGVVTFTGRGTIQVKFDTHAGWSAQERDLELVEASNAKFEVGDKVLLVDASGTVLSANSIVKIESIEYRSTSSVYVVRGFSRLSGASVTQYVSEKCLSKNIKTNQQAVRLLRRD